MPVFVYRASDRQGKTVGGVMEAPDPRVVIERLHREHYYPILVAPQAEGRRGWASLGLPGSRVRGRDLTAFTHQLATLVEAGLPLDRALDVLLELSPGGQLRHVIEDVLHTVRSGSSLAEALAKHHPHPFSRLYVNMVRAGERGGVLEVALRRLAEFLEASQEFREALLSALIYPLLLTGVGGGATVFLLTFVVPRFSQIFADLGQTIPLPTQILLAVSALLQSHGWLLLLVILAFLLAHRIAIATPRGRLAWDRVKLGLPRVGEILQRLETARFARTLGTLLQSGVPLLQSLTVVREILGNQLLVRAADQLTEGVKRGAGLSVPMRDSQVFPPLAIHMVRVGEETGRLEEMLLKVAETFEAEVRTATKRFISLLEPAMILAMGCLVGFIVLSMLLAIFSINEIPL